MKSYLKRYQKILFPVFDVALNGFNYFFHILISWYLMPKDYGSLNSLLAFLAILVVAGISFQVYTAKSVAQWGRVSEGIFEIIKLAGIFLGISSGALVLGIPVINNLTRGSYTSVVLVIVIFILNLVLSILRGIMQGLENFTSLNLSFYLEVLSKVFFLWVFISRYRNAEIALLSIIVGMMVSLVHGIGVFRSQGIKKESGKSRNKSIGCVIREVSKAYVATFFFYFYTSIDMIVVNYYLPESSGEFAVVLKYSQILLFASFSLITVFIPALSERKDDRVRFEKNVGMALGIVLAMGLFIILAYKTFVPMTVGTFFGSEYKTTGGYLVVGAVPYLFLVLSNLFINVHIILENTEYLISLFLMSIVVSVLLIFNHNSIERIFFVESVCYGLLFVILVVQYFIWRKKEGRVGYGVLDNTDG